MKFPRNARIFRGRLDVAPFALVFFLLAIFIMLMGLVYTPGISLELPRSQDLPGTDQPTVAVAIDPHGKLYYRNQAIDEQGLRNQLAMAVKSSREPLTLLVQADKNVTYDRLVRLTQIARDAGITSAWLATLPRTTPVYAPAP